ncbi:MAG: IPT/TIG domain-containing protein, partial [bacterium]
KTGPVGTVVTITGTNLTGATVKFNGTVATVTDNTTTSLKATVPTSATTGKITMTTVGGTVTSAADFTVTAAPSIIGSWLYFSATEKSVITFLDATRFSMMINKPANGDGTPGMEMGTYTWNKTTGALVVTPTVDTNGQWGFFPIGTETINITVTATTLTFHFSSAGESVCTRLTLNTAKPLVGTWSCLTPASSGVPAGDYLAIFCDDGTFLGLQHGGNTDPNGRDGIEVGTYSWNASTKQITFNLTTDTNGQWGVSHIPGIMTATVTGHSLQLVTTNGAMTWSRVEP